MPVHKVRGLEEPVLEIHPVADEHLCLWGGSEGGVLRLEKHLSCIMSKVLWINVLGTFL